MKGLNKAEITNSTKGFKELIHTTRKIERKMRKKKGSPSSLKTSSSSESSESKEELAKKKRRDWQDAVKMIRSKIVELSSTSTNMPKKGEK